MITLGVETSCDETSVAVLKDNDQVLSNIISSSLFRHKPFGGVVPEIASRHSLEQIDTVFQEALSEAKVKVSDIDVVAVTEGPGLIGSLMIGVSFAKSLAFNLGKPLVGVNHLEAHLVANFIGIEEPEHYIGLLVSGGHTMITYHRLGKVEVMGATVDDAVGEAYDKVAKILGLGFPGGPIMDKLAKKGNPKAVSFTKPKQKQPLNFSFSGIKTAALYYVRKRKEALGVETLPENEIQDIAASFQASVVSWLVEKTLRAAQEKGVKHIVVGGGVSANSHLRELLPQTGKEAGIDVYFPPFSLTLDNAAMIARRGFELYEKGQTADLALTANPNLKV